MLRSRTHPDHYLRHQGFRIKLHKEQDTELFRKDATFYSRSGLNGDPTCRSLESFNFPGRFVRHRHFELWVDAKDPAPLFGKDASFKLKTLPAF